MLYSPQKELLMPGSFSNAFIKLIVNSPLHRMLGPNFAVLSVTGLKSGKTISFPVNAFRQGEVFMVITLRERNWWRNLEADPRARLRIGGKNFDVHGDVIEAEPDVIEVLQQYFLAHPKVARYFNVRISPDGQPDSQDLAKAAAGRLAVRLSLHQASG
jgi:deazaflavin-dependent oxidoreductase (nitroreductase family)